MHAGRTCKRKKARGVVTKRSTSYTFGSKPYHTIVVFLRACLHEGGGPQVGEVTCGGSPHLTCKRDHIKMRDYMDRWVTPPNQVTSPTWDPPPPCKQALSQLFLP